KGYSVGGQTADGNMPWGGGVRNNAFPARGAGPRATPPLTSGRARRTSTPRTSPACRAQVAELVDALVSGTSAARRGSSSLLLGTMRRASLWAAGIEQADRVGADAPPRAVPV